MTRPVVGKLYKCISRESRFYKEMYPEGIELLNKVVLILAVIPSINYVKIQYLCGDEKFYHLTSIENFEDFHKRFEEIL